MDYDFERASAQPPAIVAQIPGGYQKVDLKSEEAKTAIQTALILIRADKALAGQDWTKPEALEVQRQVVSGRNYSVKLRIGKPNARQVLTIVYYEHWSSTLELTSVHRDGKLVVEH